MKKNLLLSASFMLAALFSFAQKSNRVIEGKQGMYPSFVRFTPGSAPSFTKGQLHLTDMNARITSSKTEKIIGLEKDLPGSEHYRYQQSINGIPVEHAIYIVHAKAGKVIAENGKWIKDIPQSLPAVTLQEPSALAFALQFVNAHAYKWQSAKEEAFIKREQNNPNASFYPKGELVYYSGEEDVIPSALRPAYKFDIYASDPLSRQIVFVDAVNGKILGKRELLHSINVEGIAVTGYSGLQTITSDDNGNGVFTLNESQRAGQAGNGIHTYNMQSGSDFSAAVDFTNASNTWNIDNFDKYARDAHWGAEKTFDYYYTKYGRNSIDNAGMAINGYVHFGLRVDNAYWDGTRMLYGDGGLTRDQSWWGIGTSYKPYTTLDICGHELSHGITRFTSNLTYRGESGALNEAFSDIMGTAIEFYARPGNADWLMGGDRTVGTLRSLSDPKAYGQPNTYNGTNWYTGIGDNGGVHTNSGVLNFWFYLLSQGGTGTNDNGTSYNVSGIGMDEAAAIIYRTNTSYLTSTSDYANARDLSIQAAIDLYQEGSNEVIQTTNAWTAVGVGVIPCRDDYEDNNTVSTAKTIPLYQNITAAISSPQDVDWFTFLTSNGLITSIGFTNTNSTKSRVKITLSNLPGNYNMKLYSRSGDNLIASSENGGTTDETITQDVYQGYYTVEVYGAEGAVNTSCYTLRVEAIDIDEDLDGGGGSAALNAAGTNSGVNPNMGKLNSVAVFPNPVKNKLTVYVNAENSSFSELSMIDISGRTLLMQPVQIKKGANTMSINLPHVAAGIYIIKIPGLKSTKVQVIE